MPVQDDIQFLVEQGILDRQPPTEYVNPEDAHWKIRATHRPSPEAELEMVMEDIAYFKRRVQLLKVRRQQLRDDIAKAQAE